MWYNNRNVLRTHAKDGSRMAWAIISGVAGWKRVRPASSDGVTNVFALLCAARANGRLVDVYIDANQITQVTLK